MGRMSVDMEEMAVAGQLSHEFLVAWQDWTVDRHRARERPSALQISQMERAMAWPGRYLYRRVDREELLAFQLDTYANAFGLDLRRLMLRKWIDGSKYSVQAVLNLSFAAADRIADGLLADDEVLF